MSIQSLLDNPSEHDFYQAVFALQKQLAQGKAQYRKVGHDSLPVNELVRFKAEQHLGFPGQPIKEVKKNDTSKDVISVDMLVSFMGLTGSSGALPQHYSELVLERLKLKDTGMKDFYDLFNHRLISLFYRAWEKYRFSVNYQNDQSHTPDSFTFAINKLAGDQKNSLLYAGIFNKNIRSVDGLTSILSHFTQSEVLVKQFKGKWQKLAKNEQTRLAARRLPEGQFARLGFDASIGSRVWDINSGVEIYIKPQPDNMLSNYDKRLEIVKEVKSLVTSYLGIGIKFKLFLEIKQGIMPIVQLSKGGVPLGMGGGLVSRKEKFTNSYSLPL
ncbi:type VI secretion system baseplate subunit TssG [Pseudocolwellia sp. HL-MZ19]|uniref:type VI secretion system baseplate subunit TssG n=1 Tax=unclassified Pseudocolwellia TaxID=2848178 RepID=UPI003CE67CBB